jgi:hypothetical protein
MRDLTFICRSLRTSAAVFFILGSPVLADEVSYRSCFDNAAPFITNNIIQRCRSDMAKIMAETGKTKADLSDEEQTCEATARTAAETKANAECQALLSQPPIRR